ncbi:MAG: hypothetical protein ABS41_04850 [Arenimonas sp. SCN 70-307]|nr:MAG: hypothetical protein ABS41_04850 [Arenimonas sp. SCN 70-307]
MPDLVPEEVAGIFVRRRLGQRRSQDRGPDFLEGLAWDRLRRVFRARSLTASDGALELIDELVLVRCPGALAP